MVRFALSRSGRGTTRRGALIAGGVVCVLCASAAFSAGASGKIDPTPVLKSTVPSVAEPARLKVADARILYSLKVDKRVVFITIDDGGYIAPSLVRYLNANRIPVTSFVMPEPLLWMWGRFRQIKSMDYGNHTNTHRGLRRMGFSQQRGEICRAKRLVDRISGQSPVLFRPPGGDFNATTVRAMVACGTRYLVLWNVIADDQIIRMRRSHRLLPGDIILMHYRSDIIASLDHLMNQLRHDGLRPALLADYLKYGRP